MNRIYRTLWSVATQSWQAVPETAKTAGKKSKSSSGGVVASVALSWVLTCGANAQAPPAMNQLPTGGVVTRGTATIHQTATAQAAAMTVNQSSQRAVINWDTFNIGSKASVNFVQPNAQSVTLNRVNDSNPSQIFGRITANGQVFLTNANGVYFSPTSSVDVGAITATTHSISDDNFMSGNYVFVRNGAWGKVVNEGKITAAMGGYVALLAPEVQNAGVVVARAGTVAMGAGETIVLNIDANGSLAGISTTPSAIASLIENKLAVQAPDGQIFLSSVAVNKLRAGVIKNSGSLEASSLVNKGGKIYLEGDDITLERNSKIEAKGPKGGGIVLVGGDWQGSGDMRQATKVTMEAGGTIDASATDKGDGGKVVLWSDVHNADSQTTVAGTVLAQGLGENTIGGQIETSGAKLQIADSAAIRMGGVGATGGRWLLDPVDFTIASSGGNTTGAALGSSITAGNTVEILNTSGTTGTSGNINVNDSVSWNNTGVLKLTASGGVTGSGAIGMGTGGGLIFNQTGNTTYSGVISGAGSVTKLGTGTLVLSGSSTNTGTVTINGGKITSNGATVVDTSSPLGVNPNIAFGVSGGTLDISSASSSLQIASLTGSGTVALGANTLSVGAGDVSSSYAGSFTSTAGGTLKHIGTGTLSLTYGSSAIYNQATNISAGAIQFNVTSPYTVTLNTAVITGGGTLMKSGTGTLNISAAQAMTGNTTVNGGVLGIGNAAALGTTGTATVNNGGTLQLQTVTNYNLPTTLNAGGTLSGTGTSTVTTPITLGGNATLDVATNATLTLNGVISDGASSYQLSKTSTGTAILNAANTYDGGTVISAGTLRSTFSSVGSAGSITSGPFGTGTVTVQSGGMLDLSTMTNFYNNLGLTGSYALKISDTSSPTLSGNIVLNGNAGITVSSTTASYTLTGNISESVGGSGLSLSASSTTPVNNITGALSYTGRTTTGSGTYSFSSSNLVAGLNGGTGITITSGSLRLDNTGGSSNLSVPVSINGSLSLAGALTMSGAVSITGIAQLYSLTSGQAAALTGSVTGTNTSLTFGGAGNWNVSAPISLGTGALTKQDAGTATLSGLLSYKNTSINGGTLVFNGNAVVPIDSTLSFWGTSSFNVSTPGAVSSIYSLSGSSSNQSLLLGANALTITNASGTFSGVITSTSGLTLSGGAETLSGANTFGVGAVVKSGANLTVANNTALGASTLGVTVEPGGTLTASGTTAFANPISVSGAGVGGSGALKWATVSSNTAFSGPITLNGDTVIGGVDGYLRLTGLISETTPSAITAKSGFFAITNVNNTYSGGTTIANSAMLWVGAGSTTGTPGAVTKGQLGTGPVTVQAGGTLELDNSAVLGNAIWAGGSGSGISYRVGFGGSQVNAFGTGAIQSLNYQAGAGGQLTGPVHLTSDIQFGVSALGSVFVLGDMTEVNPGTKVTVTNKGAYTALGRGLVLTGNNNWTGGTFLGTTGGGYVGVTLGTSTQNPTATSLPGSLTLVTTLSPDASSFLNVYNNALTNVDYSFNLSGAFTFGKLGSGPMTLTGNNSNFTGPVKVLGGTLKINAVNSLGSNTVSVGAGGTLDLNGYSVANNFSLDHSSSLINSSSTAVNLGSVLTFTAPPNGVTPVVSIGGVGDITLSNPISAIANVTQKSGLTKVGTDTLTLAGDNTFNALTISEGTLKLGTNATLQGGTYASNVSNSGTFEDASSVDLAMSGVISGSGNLLKSTSSTSMLTLSGVNTLTGTTTVSAGTLKLTGNGALTGSSLVDNGTFDISGVTSLGNVKSLSGSGSVVLGAKTLQLNSASDSFSGIISGTGGLNLLAGTETLSNNNTYTGTTSISSGAILTLGNDGNTGGVSGAITDNGTLIYKHANNITIGTAISGSGGLQQSGTGTLSLTGINTYAGTTVVNSGTLQVGDLSNTSAKLGTGVITNYGNLNFYRSGALALSAMAPNAGAITGNGNVTVQATGTVNVDRAITLNGANSAIYVEAGANSAANTSLVSDVTLTNTITTSNTGTIAVFEGSPTATVANGSTANLSLKMVGATGSVKYKTYNASLASLSSVVAGTRNFYYRLQPTLTINGATISASKTYDGNTIASNAVVSGGVASSAIDADTMGFTVSGAAYSTPTAGTNKAMTATVTTTSTNSAWVVNGYLGTMSGTNYLGTINKAALSITANNDARFVTQSDAAGYAGVSYAGFVNGETAADLTGTLSIARSTPLDNSAGSYTLTPSGLTSLNYTITNNPGTYTIIPANQLLVRLIDTPTVYGTAPTYSISSAQYVMPDNSLIDLTNQLSLSGTTYTLNDGASGNARFSLGISNGTYSASGNLNVGVWNATAIGATTTSRNFSNVLTVVGTQTVTPRTLTVSATAANKVYDGTTTATLSNFSDNRIAGDALSLTQTGATFATKNAQPQQTVTINGVALSGNDAGNYVAPAATLTTTADITQKALTLTGLSAASKTYDGNTSVTMNSYGTLSGVVGIEDVRIDSSSVAAAFATKTAGVGKLVNITGLTLGGTDIANYSLANPFTTTANIDAKALTVTGTSVANKTYDATTIATLTDGTLSGVISGDAVTLTQAGSFVDKNYSALAKTVNAANSLSGADAGNYTLTQPTGLTAFINKADLVIGGISAVNKIYNATTAATVTGSATATPLLNDVVTVVGTPTANFDTKDVGTGKPVTITGYTLTGLDSGNYNPVQPTGLTANISKASLNVTGVSAVDKVYDATTVGTLTGAASVTALLTDSVSVSGTPVATFADKNVSASAIGVSVTGYTLTGTDADNYNVVQPTGLSAFITPKALSMTGLSTPTSKTYDGNTSATVTGNATLLSASAAGAGSSTDGKPYAGDLLTLSSSPVGAYNSKDVATATTVSFTGMSLSGSAAGNYTLSSYAPAAATITPKDLTVKANNDANFFALPDTSGFNGVSYLGFVAGESAANLSFANNTAPTVTSSLSAGQRSTPGTYTGVLTPGGINAGNYHPMYQSGDFTVVPADTLLIRTSNTSLTYGTSAALATPTASYYSTTYGSVGNLTVTRNGDAFDVADLVNGGSATVTLAPIRTAAQVSHSGNTAVGFYNIGASSVTNLVGNNFSNSVTVSGTQTIVPKALTIDASASNKVYNGSSAATVALSSGDALLGDVLSYDKTSATFVNQNAALSKTVTVNGLTLSGADAGNYSLQNISATTTANITPKVVQLTATKTYDGSTVLSNSQVTVNTGVGSETLTYSGAALASKNVADNATNTVAAITLLDGTGATAGLASNYTFSTARDANNTVTLTPASLTFAAVTDAKVYDSTQNSSQTVLVTNNSGSNDVVTVQQEFASKNVLGVGLSTLQVKPGFTVKDSSNADMSGNYVVTSSTTAAGTITPADLAITGVAAANKVYDATTNANLTGTAVVSALGADEVSVSGTGTGQFADKNAGTGKSVSVTGYALTGADAGNYNVVQPIGLTADISKAPLTVTAVDAVKNFGSVNPPLNVVISGFVGGETDATSGVTGAGLATTNATTMTTAGSVAIVASIGTLAASNYAFTHFVDGTLTIRPIAVLNNNEVATLIGSQLANLTGTQVGSFSAKQLQVFTPQQLSALSPSQLAGMTTAQLLALSPIQIAAISPAKISLLSAAELSAFSDAQLQALSVEQIAAISPDHFSAFSPEQIMALSISQVVTLTPDQLRAFSPAQVASLSAAELAYFDARQLAAIGIFPKAESPVVTTIAPEVQQTAASSSDAKDDTNKFEAPIPVMTEVATSNVVPTVVAAVAPTRAVVAEPSATLTASPTQPASFATNVESTGRNGVLAITILNGAEVKPTTAGIAFEQDANTVSLRFTAAPPVPPVSDTLVFNDKLTTFMVASINGDMVEFQGTVVNKRLIVVASTAAAKRVARNEMNMVLAAAITSLGTENRVVLANLDSVVIDLR